MAIGLRPPVAGHVLDHRQNAAGETPFHYRASKRDHRLGIGREGAIADYFVRASLGHVEDGRAIDGNATVVELLRRWPRSSEGGLLRHLLVGLIEQAIAAGGWHVPPMRRAKPLNAASLLINEDQRVVALDRLMVRADECPDLLRRLAVPRKQDQTAGPF